LTGTWGIYTSASTGYNEAREGTTITFLVDMGATYLVLNQALMPLGCDYSMVKGATGQSEKAYFCKPLKYK